MCAQTAHEVGWRSGRDIKQLENKMEDSTAWNGPFAQVFPIIETGEWRVNIVRQHCDASTAVFKTMTDVSRHIERRLNEEVGRAVMAAK